MKTAYYLLLFMACVLISTLLTDLRLAIATDGLLMAWLGMAFVKPLVMVEIAVLGSKVLKVKRKTKTWKTTS